jgi:hypothetical protein
MSVVRQLAGADYTTTSLTFVEIDATNIRRRMECSGAPVRMGIRGLLTSAVVQGVWLAPTIDGVGIDGSQGAQFRQTIRGAGDNVFLNLDWIAVPSPGSHLFSWQWVTTGGGTLTLDRGTDYPVETFCEELVRQNTSND